MTQWMFEGSQIGWHRICHHVDQICNGRFQWELAFVGGGGKQLQPNVLAPEYNGILIGRMPGQTKGV